jgi:SAM-dependent methyltransferase
MSNHKILYGGPSKLCVACSFEIFRPVGRAKIIDPASTDEFNIWACANCHHWVTDPLPSAHELAELYSVGSLRVLGDGLANIYASGDITGKVESSENWVVQRSLDLIPGNFLEIGPGDGSLMRKFRELGWSAFGVDPGQYLSDKSIFRNAEDLPSNKSFQVIVLQDVLEHTSNPWEELSQYKKYLTSGSRVYMTFPWSESREAQKLGAHWSMVRPVGHLHYFSKSSAKSLLNSIDAKLVSIRIVNLMPSKIQRTKNLVWLLSTFPLQYFRRGVRKNPYRQRLRLLWQSYISFRSDGDQLYVEGVIN